MNKAIFFTHNDNDFKLFFNKKSLVNLKKDIKIIKNPLNKHLNDEEILKYSEDASIIICEWWTGAGKFLFKNKKNLKAIIRAGVEIKNIDFKAAKEANVKIINIPDAYSNAVVELVICFIFSLARNINHFYKKTIQGDYNEAIIEMLSQKKIKFKNFPQIEVSGSYLGIIGYGSVGQLLKKKAEAIGMKILVYDPFCNKNKKDVNFVNLNYLLKNSKFISLNASLNENKYLISMKELKLMSKDSFLINTARGNLINTSDLVIALKNKIIAGAAIDVLETSKEYDAISTIKWKHSEDFSSSPLSQFENVILTPHIAGLTEETITKQSNKIVEIINLLYDNQLPQSVINLDDI